MAKRDSTSHFFTTKLGTKTHYQRTGNTSGSLIILLHGLGGSTKTFDPLLPHLPIAQYHIVGVDFEGFGKTALSSHKDPISLRRHVSDLDNLIAYLQGTGASEAIKDPIIIVGHSLGSIVALHYATARPENVAGLGLLGVGRSASHIEAARQRMLGMAETVRREGIQSAAHLALATDFAANEDTPAAVRQGVWNAVAASHPEGYAQTCEAMISPEHADPEYGSIDCPVVLVSGEGDSISPPSRAQDLSKLVGGKSDVFVVRGGHQPILSDLEGTSKAMNKLFALTRTL